MKVLSSLIIIDEDNIKIIYECDNKKNTECEAHNDCKYCDYTTEAKYAKDIKEERRKKKEERTRIELKEDLKEKQEEIEQHKETIRRMMSGEDIFHFRTPNYIRKIFILNQIK